MTSANVTIRVHCAAKLKPGTPVRRVVSQRSQECVHVEKVEVADATHVLVGITMGECIRDPLEKDGFYAAVSVMGPTPMVRENGRDIVLIGTCVTVGNRDLLVLGETDDENMMVVLV